MLGTYFSAPRSVSRINTSLEIGASRMRTHAWRRSGSDRRFHARLQSRLWWPHVLARICPVTIMYVTVQRCRRLQRPADKRSTAKLGKATAGRGGGVPSQGRGGGVLLQAK